MRAIILVPFLAGVAVAQTIDIAGVKAYPKPATPTFAHGIPTQAIPYSPASAAASVFAEVIAALHLHIGTPARPHVEKRDAAPDAEANPRIPDGLDPRPIPGPIPVTSITSTHTKIHTKTKSSHLEVPSHVSVRPIPLEQRHAEADAKPSFVNGPDPHPIPGPIPITSITSAHTKTHTKTKSSSLQLPSHVSVRPIPLEQRHAEAEAKPSFVNGNKPIPVTGISSAHTKTRNSHLHLPSHVRVQPLPLHQRDVAARDDSSTSTACQPEATGAGHMPTPDTPAAFASDPYFGNVAVAANIPDNYELVFTNLTASNIAYGYLGYQYINAYHPAKCAALCNNLDGCTAFNLYFERDPQITPGSACLNPNSTTTIKCAFWGGDINTANAINFGQYREKFQVLIAGSNGYVRHDGCNSPVYPGYSQPEYLGNGTILAQPDCNGVNSYLGWDFITTGPFDPNLCAAACTALSEGNLANNNSQTCQFYATYILNENNVALGQYCAMYSEYWDDSFATNVGQYDGTDHYTISNAYSSYNLTNPGYANPKCSWQHVPVANTVCGGVSASSSASASSTSVAALSTSSATATRASPSSTALSPIITSSKASTTATTTTPSSLSSTVLSPIITSNAASTTAATTTPSSSTTSAPTSVSSKVSSVSTSTQQPIAYTTQSSKASSTSTSTQLPASYGNASPSSSSTSKPSSSSTTAQAASTTSSTPVAYSPSPSMTTSTTKAIITSTTTKASSTSAALPPAYGNSVTSSTSTSKTSSTSTTAKASSTSSLPPAYGYGKRMPGVDKFIRMLF